MAELILTDEEKKSQSWVANFTQELETAQSSTVFQAERIMLTLAEDIVQAMDRQGLRRVDVARKMGVSRSFVTRVLRCDSNITVDTLVRMAMAVGVSLEIRAR